MHKHFSRQPALNRPPRGVEQFSGIVKDVYYARHAVFRPLRTRLMSIRSFTFRNNHKKMNQSIHISYNICMREEKTGLDYSMHNGRTTVDWYALRCKPNMEFTVWTQLLDRGVPTFFPRLEVTPANPRSRTEKPYFPGYLFVSGTPEALYARRVSLLRGTMTLVSFDGEPASIPDGLIEAIRRQVASDNLVAQNPASAFTTGDRVRVESGELKGFDGVFEKCVNGEERVFVLLNLMRGRQVRVDLPAASLSPLAHPHRARC